MDDPIQLIQKKLGGKVLSTEEQALLDRWAQDNPGELESYQKFWDLYGKMRLVVEVDPHETWNKLQEPKPAKRSLFWPMAAAITLICLVGATFFMLSYDTYTFETMGSNEISLKDGSSIWLHEGASLQVPYLYGVFSRKINLSGQAYFDVAHDAGKSFEVHGQRGMVSVLGTTFQYRSYSDSEDLVLLTGKVHYLINDKTHQLAPGDRLEWKEGQVATSTIENQNFLFWKTRTLEYRQTPLGDILEDLGHYYEATIDFDEEKVHCPISIVFQNQSLDEVLEELSYVAGFSVVEIDHQYKIESPSCK